MKTKRVAQSAFSNPRFVIGLLITLTGAFLGLLDFGPFVRAASITPAQQSHTYTNLIDPLVPAGFDCSKIRELGIDKQENLRAGAIMIFCGLSQGGIPFHGSGISKFVQKLMAPVSYGSTDVDLITGTESFPNVTQSTTFSTANPDNPNQIVVAYNDTRGRNANPINGSGASVSTDGGTTFTRLTYNGQSPFPNTGGGPVVLYSRDSTTWYTVWSDSACGGGLGGTSLPLRGTLRRPAGSITTASSTIHLPTAILAGWTTTHPLPTTETSTFPLTTLINPTRTSSAPFPLTTAPRGTVR